MNVKLSALLDIAATIFPAIGSLVGNDKTGKIMDDVAKIIKKLSKTDDAKKIKAKLQKDPALRIEMQKHLANLAHQETQEQNRAKEEERRQELDSVRQNMAERERQHQADLDLIQQRLDSTNAARDFSQQLALSERWWVAGINPLLSVVITLSFFVFVYLIAHYPIGGKTDTANVTTTAQGVAQPGENKDGGDTTARIIDPAKPAGNGKTGEIAAANEDNDGGNNARFNKEAVFYVAFGTLATAFATIIGFHFGSSSGSKRKTQMRQYLIPPAQPNPSSPQIPPARRSPGRREDEISPSNHPFEAFWRQNFAHIENFTWNELLYKGASHSRLGSNTDPTENLYGNVVPLVNMLEKIRKEIGAPVRLLSVYRSPAYNNDINGAPSSRHMQFDAADFHVVGAGHGNSGRWASIVKKLRDRGEFKGGIGIYDTFVHIDTRGNNADWDMR